MSVVRLTRVCKAFANGARGLGPIDLEIGQGEVVTLIGPSGCGKTTALRLIAGLVEPSEGEVVWPGERPEIGYVFQEPTLMPWASAFANVWLPLRLRDVPKAEARPRIEEALERVGLRDAAALKPHQLSGGMRMRVSIARALVTRPKLLLMDEPFAALDEITRFHLNDELLALREKLGLTLVFVTHSVFEAVYLSSRVVIMTPVPGRIVEEVAVPEPFPRTDAFRTSVAYAELARRISAALRQSSESRLDKAGIAVHS